MTTIRRLYFYLVAAASLAVLVTGLTGGGVVVLGLLLHSGALESTYRLTLADYGAMVVVGFPLWAFHWRYAQRLAAADVKERSAALRRLYTYAVLGALLIALGQYAGSFLSGLLGSALAIRGLALDTSVVGITGALWQLALVATFWTYIFRVAGDDRRAVGEQCSSATLRRWYAYGSQCVALLAGLFAAASLLHVILVSLIAPTTLVDAEPAVAGGLAGFIVASIIWLFHRRWTNGGVIVADDRRSTLRPVYGFAIVVIGVVATLMSVGEIFYWCAARLLGVPRPSGLPGDPVTALSGAVATGMVFATGWAWMRHDLARDAADAAAVRQAGVRRLYEHLIAFVALATFCFGAGLLLWSVVDEFLGRGLVGAPIEFRDRISLSITFIIVGLPLWLRFWRPAAPVEDRLAFSRRLYTFAGLLSSILAGLAFAVWLVVLLLRLLLGVGEAQPALDIGHALALVLLAAAVLGYHVRILRMDAGLRAVPVPSASGTQIGTPVVIEISGATEEEIQSFLGNLPSSATYRIRRCSSAAAEIH